MWNNIRCSKCLQPIDNKRRRISKKGKNWVMCTLCNSKNTVLSRWEGFHEMQTALKTFSKEERGACWAKVGDKHGNDLKDFVKKTVERSMYRRNEEGNTGRYLPLAAWEKLGYDPVLIATHCTDIMEDPVSGTTYCVNVVEKSNLRGKREEHKDTLTNGCPSGGHATAQKKNADLKLKNNRGLAKKIKDKLKSAMYEIANVMKKKEFKSIEQSAQKSVTDLKKKLTSYEKKAETALSDGNDMDITYELVCEKVKQAIAAAGLVDNMIDTKIAFAAMGDLQCNVNT